MNIENIWNHHLVMWAIKRPQIDIWVFPVGFRFRDEKKVADEIIPKNNWVVCEPLYTANNQGQLVDYGAFDSLLVDSDLVVVYL